MYVEMVVIEACPMDMQQSTYRGIVQNVYALAKDQIHDARGLKALVCKILPTLRELSIQRNSIYANYIIY